MTSISAINENIKTLLENIDDEEILEEVKIEYVPFEKNMNVLLECDSLDLYLEKYETMCNEEDSILACFEFENADELKKYIEEKEISFDELKSETVQASCESLELIIFEAEADY